MGQGDLQANPKQVSVHQHCYGKGRFRGLDMLTADYVFVVVVSITAVENLSLTSPTFKTLFTHQSSTRSTEVLYNPHFITGQNC